MNRPFPAEWIVPEWPAPAPVRAVITTRLAGPEYPENVADPVAGSALAVGAWLPSEPVWLKQVHGVCVVSADEAPAGATADGAVARMADRVCAVRTADCLPVFLCDDAGSVVGIAHAGWRGMAAGIIENVVQEMDVPGKRLIAYLGPGIGASAYEVGRDVYEAFVSVDSGASAAFAPIGTEKYLADLYALASRRLRRLGTERIFGGRYCTFTDSRRFYSYRREGNTGRMASLIWIGRG